MRYIVHVGRHKTGTTALQRALAASDLNLKSHGVLYPHTGRRPFGHHNLADSILGSGELVEKARQEIELEDPHTVIMSSERLQGVSPATLASVFPSEQTEVVMYIREQVDYLLSAYAQRVQASDLCEPFEEFANRLAPAIDYMNWLKPFERVFGRKNLHVRVYDRALITAGGSLPDFLSILGLNHLEVTEPDAADANPSLDFDSLRLKLVLNGLGFTAQEETRGALYRLFQKSFQQPGSRGPGLVIPPNVQDSLRERFARSNRKVLSRYVRGGDKQFRFRDLSSDSGPYSTAQLVEVFEMIDQWQAIGGPEFVGERMTPTS